MSISNWNPFAMNSDGTVTGNAVIPSAADVSRAMKESLRDNPPVPPWYDEAELCAFLGIRREDLPIAHHAGLPLPDQFRMRTHWHSGIDESTPLWSGFIVRNWYDGFKEAAKLLRVK